MVDIERDDSGIASLPDSVHRELCALFKEYNNKLLPLVASVEVLKGQFPGQVLNEIRACFSHIARCFHSSVNENDCLNELKKAHGHITRAILDCYKIMLLYFFDEVNTFRQQYANVNLTLVSDGEFLPSFIRLNEIAITKSRKAKQIEVNSFPEKEDSYPAYKDAILAYNDVFQWIKSCGRGLANAEQHGRDMSAKENKRSWKFAFIGAGIGAVFGAIVR